MYGILKTQNTFAAVAVAASTSPYIRCSVYFCLSYFFTTAKLINKGVENPKLLNNGFSELTIYPVGKLELSSLINIFFAPNAKYLHPLLILF